MYADGCFSPLSTRLLDIIATNTHQTPLPLAVPRPPPVDQQKPATSFAGVIVLAHMIHPLDYLAHCSYAMLSALATWQIESKMCSHFSSSLVCPRKSGLDFPLFCSTFLLANNKKKKKNRNKTNAKSSCRSCWRCFLLMTSLSVRWESVHQVFLVVYHISLLVANTTF